MPFFDPTLSVRSTPPPLPSSTDQSTLSVMAQEQYALLEQVLRKDEMHGHASALPPKPERPNDSIGSPLMGEDFYLGDMMTDTPVQQHHHDMSSAQVLPVELKVGDRLVAGVSDSTHKDVDGAEHSLDIASLDSEAAATDISSGLDSFCASHQSDGGPGSGNQQSPHLMGIFEAKKPESSDEDYDANQETIRQFRTMIPFHSAPFSRAFFEGGKREDGEYDTKCDDEDEQDFVEDDEGMDAHSINANYDTTLPSNRSNMSMSSPGIGSHPDLYENIDPLLRAKVDALARKISGMPRRKLRECLAQRVTIEDVEPLMVLNRDELAGMLGLGVTTWKMFVHNSLGVPRWPARALKSQLVKENKLLQRLKEAEMRGDSDTVHRLRNEHSRVVQSHMKRRKMFRLEAKQRLQKPGFKKRRGLYRC